MRARRTPILCLSLRWTIVVGGAVVAGEDAGEAGQQGDLADRQPLQAEAEQGAGSAEACPGKQRGDVFERAQGAEEAGWPGAGSPAAARRAGGPAAGHGPVAPAMQPQPAYQEQGPCPHQ